MISKCITFETKDFLSLIASRTEVSISDASPCPHAPRLDSGEVHLWLLEMEVLKAALSDPKLLKRKRSEATPEKVAETASSMSNSSEMVAPAMDLLSQEEKAQAMRIKRSIDRTRYILGKMAVRTLLAAYLFQRAEALNERIRKANALQFEAGIYGKPQLSRSCFDKVRPIDVVPDNLKSPDSGHSKPPISFNLSHSGKWLVIAITRDGEIGTDVQEMNPKKPFRELARRFFSAAEARRVEDAGARKAAPEASESKKPEGIDGSVVEFYWIWAEKEAYLKAKGIGLAEGMEKEVPDDVFRYAFERDGYAFCTVVLEEAL